MWSKIFYTLVVFFLIFSIRYNPEFTASALRSGWFWLRAFTDSLGRLIQAL